MALGLFFKRKLKKNLLHHGCEGEVRFDLIDSGVSPVVDIFLLIECPKGRSYLIWACQRQTQGEGKSKYMKVVLGQLLCIPEVAFFCLVPVCMYLLTYMK